MEITYANHKGFTCVSQGRPAADAAATAIHTHGEACTAPDPQRDEVPSVRLLEVHVYDTVWNQQRPQQRVERTRLLSRSTQIRYTNNTRQLLQPLRHTKL